MTSLPGRDEMINTSKVYSSKTCYQLLSGFLLDALSLALLV